VKAGDVIILKKEDYHSYYSVKDLCLVNLCFRAKHEKGLGKEIEEINSSVFSLPFNYVIDFENLIFMLEKEMKSKEEFYKDNISHIVSMMIVMFKRSGCFVLRHEKKWEECIKMMTEKSGDVTLSQVAKNMHYSKNYFCRAFKKHFGITFLEYLNNIRIQKVKSLLLDTQMSIESIYREVGFSQSKQFYSMFKAMTGMTPLKYRQHYGQKSE